MFCLYGRGRVASRLTQTLWQRKSVVRKCIGSQIIFAGFQCVRPLGAGSQAADARRHPHKETHQRKHRLVTQPTHRHRLRMACGQSPTRYLPHRLSFLPDDLCAPAERV